MSDAIVAASIDSTLSMLWNCHVHNHICKAINLDVTVHPSFAALKKEAGKKLDESDNSKHNT
jgi:hypothetical protein